MTFISETLVMAAGCGGRGGGGVGKENKQVHRGAVGV